MSFLPAFRVAVATVACAFLAASTPAPRQVDLVVVGATAIDPASGAVVPNATIAIADGKIVAVESATAARFSTKRTIEANGAYVVPAFADMHVHWGNGVGLRRDDIVEVTLARNLYYGVTRVLNLGANRAGPADIDAYRAKLADGTWQGSTIYAAGSLITVAGSHPTTTIFSAPMQKQIAAQVAAAPSGPVRLDQIAVTVVRSAADMRKEVAHLAAWKADTIKIVIDSGPESFGVHPQMPLDVAKAAVEAAHAKGIRVLAHVSEPDDLAEALDAGVDGIAHAITPHVALDAALTARMGTRKSYLVATLSMFDGLINWSGNPKLLDDTFLRETLSDAEIASAIPAAPFARDRELLGGDTRTHTLRAVGAAHKAGAVVLTGTDSGNPFVFPGYSLHEELRLLVEAGLTPIEALAAASHNAARYLRAEKTWGSLAVGQAADLIVLAANPLDDIRNTRRIVHVIQHGKPVERSALKVR